MFINSSKTVVVNMIEKEIGRHFQVAFSKRILITGEVLNVELNFLV